MIYPNRPAFFRDGVEIFDAENLNDMGDECPICRHAELKETEVDANKRVVKISHCYHVFHHFCLSEALNFTPRKSPGRCPYCRQKLYQPSSLNVPREERIKLLKIEVRDLRDRTEGLEVNLWEASLRSQSGPDRHLWEHMKTFYRELHLKVDQTLLEMIIDLEILLWN
jgi:predicted nucleic-acid-binding Zn-ribbon protein